MKALALLVVGAVIPGLDVQRADPLRPTDRSGVVAGAGGAARAPQSDAPFKSPSREPLDFRGPGREARQGDVDEVVLGWFGPGDPDHPEFGDFWRGATLALEEENAAGGYRNKPFRLLPAWSETPWKAGISDLARLFYGRGAWAVLGGVDGTTTHLAVQLALKSHFLLLSPGSTDVTTDDANVPWLFSLRSSDERVSPAVADAVGRAAGGGPFAVLASADHDSHAALVATRRALFARGLSPAVLVEFATVDPDLTALAGRLLRERPRALVVLAPATAAGRLVAEVQGAGWRGTIIGGATLGRKAFARAARGAADGVLAWLPAGAGPEWDRFARASEMRWGEAPDEATARGYDAVRLAVAAVRRAGLNRARIRDAVRDLSPWPGVYGPVSWNAQGRSDGALRLARWSAGRLVPVD